jgi:hypothetical protein
MRWYVPKASLIPALVLAMIVGFTFLTLRNYGPESTVRTFHATLSRIYQNQMTGKGIPRKDWEVVRGLLVEDAGVPMQTPGDARAIQAISYVIDSFRNNATYSLARMDRYPNEVRIAVLYTHPNRMVIPMIWVVVRDPKTREWRISAAKTALA